MPENNPTLLNRFIEQEGPLAIIIHVPEAGKELMNATLRVGAYTFRSGWKGDGASDAVAGVVKQLEGMLVEKDGCVYCSHEKDAPR